MGWPQIDPAIHVGDIIVSVVGTVAGFALRRSYKAVAEFVSRVEQMDRRLEETAEVVDIHTDILIKSGWARHFSMDPVSQKRKRARREEVLGLGGRP